MQDDFPEIQEHFMKIENKKKPFANILLYISAAIGIVLIAMTCIALKYYQSMDTLKNVKFIAHRGLSSKYYENSEKAFLAAAKSDFFYGIETDVYFTADNVAVCSHDNDAFSDSSVKITSSVYDEIKDMPLKKDSYGFESSGLCRFDRYLEICAEYGKTAVIELKDYYMSDDEIKSVVDSAKSVCGDKFVIVSFSKKHIETVRSIDAEVNTQHVVQNDVNFRSSLVEGHDVTDYFGHLTKKLIDDVHGQGRKVGVWTVNNFMTAIKYANYGVDYISTDKDFSEEWWQALLK